MARRYPSLGEALDKSWENKSLEEILAAPPSALAGLTEPDALSNEAPGTTTVRPARLEQVLALAGVLVALAEKSG